MSVCVRACVSERVGGWVWVCATVVTLFFRSFLVFFVFLAVGVFFVVVVVLNPFESKRAGCC